MKGKHSGVQARMLDINPKAVYVPCANHVHTLNLVVVDSANSSTEALTFFGVLTRLYVLFSSSAQRWEILKKHVELSIKSQSDTRWESRIKCIKPLRYNLKEVLLALKDLEAISIERKDGRAASETKSLIAHLSKWSFLLSVFIWYDILFQVNKASKILQSYGVSLHTMETLYPNVYIALRILLTCPVTVASAERSFSKLKLIKTFNKTSMTDSRLSSLAMLSIENDCARSLDYDNVITAFANKKVRSRLFK